MERELKDCRKCAELELQMKKKNSEFRAIEVEKVGLVEELGVLKKKYNELECEKKNAESEVEVWKAKFKELESRMLEFEGRDKENNMVGMVKRELGLSEVGVKQMNEVSCLKDRSSVPTSSVDLQAENTVSGTKETMHIAAGKIATPNHCVEGTRNRLVSGGETLSTGTLCKQCTYNESGKRGSIPGTETEYITQVRKQLKYGEGNPTKKMGPSSVGCTSVGFIDVSDSDDEHDLPISDNQENQTVTTVSVGENLNTKECASENENIKALLDQRDEDVVGDKESSPLIATRKRRASNIVTSDSENEDALICERKTETQPNSVTEFQSNGSPVEATVSGSNIYQTASKRCRRLVSLGNAVSTPKRKVASNSVNSDSGSDDDDHVPISKLMSKSSSVPATVSRNSGSDDNDDVPLSELMQNSSSVAATTVSRNRITRAVLRRDSQSSKKSERIELHKSSNNCNNLDTREINCYPGTSSEDDGVDASVEDNELESEGESLKEFIVDGSDISENFDSDDASLGKSESNISLSGNSDNGKASGDSQNASIMSNSVRHRDHKIKWEFEAEMLADFGKDPKLCMKAVCAIYRQQTSDEKSSKGTIYSNKRGFSHHDAHRGTSLAEFLTDGDPSGDVQKSVDELRLYGIERCRDLAYKYSKQLFTIYQKKEDPFFLSEADCV